jgi:DNA-directed RNA polymerase specialized sigma24 family protein
MGFDGAPPHGKTTDEQPGEGISRQSAEGDCSGVSDECTSFEASWSRIAPKLRRMLIARGVTTSLDDILQDTALRLFANWERVDHTRSLWPLAKKIALNCAIDGHRRRVAVPIATFPDRPGPHDAEEHAFARARLARVGAALRTLRGTDQTILLGEIGIGARSGHSSAAKMARQRARRRLTQALERMGTVFGFVPAGWRRLTGWTHSQVAADVQHLLPTAAGAVAAMAIAVAGFTAGEPPARAGARQPAHSIARLPHSEAWRPARVSSKVTNKLTTSRHETEAATPPSEVPASRSPKEKSVEAGPARAHAGEGQGYRYVALCTGEETAGEADDSETTVTVYDGSQDGDDEPVGCSEEEQP